MDSVLVPIRIPVSRPAIGPAEADAVARVLQSRWLSMGAVTLEFEGKLAELLGVPYVLAVNSGSAALHLALEEVIQSPEDEVILPSLTFVSSVQMILAAGGRPVYCEVDPDTLNMDPDDVERRITPNTRAILPVHYAGRPCDMDRLRALADAHSLTIVDDAAHAFGSRYKGRMVGSLGDVTCFSFSAVKNITCGDGGAIATRRQDIAQSLHLRRNLGISTDTWTRMEFSRTWDYAVDSGGYRYPMPNLNAAIGLVQLGRREEFQSRKRALAAVYDAALRDLPGVKLISGPDEHVFPYTYPLRILTGLQHAGLRDALVAHLRQRGIGTAVHYRPNHMQPHFARPGVHLPVTEKLFNEIISLPLFTEMTDAEQDEVIAEVTFFLLQAGRIAS